MIRVSRHDKSPNAGFLVSGQKSSQKSTNTANPKATAAPLTIISKQRAASTASKAKSIALAESKPRNPAISSKTTKQIQGLSNMRAPTGMRPLVLEYEELEKEDFCGCKESQPTTDTKNNRPGQPIQGQLEMVKPRNSESMIKKLKWSDFKGSVPEDSPWLAYTMWKYSHDYKPVPTKNPNVLKIELRVKAELNPKSWVRSPHDSLLSHEQGHFDIACLCMLTFKKRVMEREFGKNTYKEEIAEIHKKVVKEFAEKQLQYDRETRHYLAHSEQLRWEKEIEEELQAMSVYEFMEITKK